MGYWKTALSVLQMVTTSSQCMTRYYLTYDPFLDGHVFHQYTDLTVHITVWYFYLRMIQKYYVY